MSKKQKITFVIVFMIVFIGSGILEKQMQEVDDITRDNFEQQK